MKECPRCLMTADIAKIGDTQCEYCDLHDTLEAQRNPEQIDAWLDLIQLDGIDKDYNCLIGVSGGIDSSILWYMAVKEWKLKPLVVHFDNGMDDTFAIRNIERMAKHLGTEVMYVKPREQQQYDNAVRAMLLAGTPDADITNDIYMTKMMYEVALKHRIHYIVNGHDYRTEGSTPKPWTRLDTGYLADIYRRFIGHRLPNEYRLTILDQTRYGWHGIKQVRPFYHMNISRAHYKSLLMQECNWTDYDHKHAENMYTAWAGYVLLPKKFGIDKRRVYLSALIRSHMMDKATARERLKQPVRVKRIGDYLTGIGISQQVMEEKPKPRSLYRQTNYRRYKWLVWLLVKAEILPYTFYVKYCK